MSNDRYKVNRIRGIDAIVGIVDDPLRLDAFAKRIRKRLIQTVDHDERQRYRKLLNDIEDHQKRIR
ncbi:hypothetical protein F9C28_14625 [Shimwellia pseudoproteus]|uniref:hypothetical protein n=1 Tax=Shimwellia pseudoproteus TaxID=570012 RepID=UPI0018ED20D8|nr:hypothetical protein [Shimwellia pseudoproteus]MBJ3816130.1 hypothetical protein [Shimwellia pseudoproteus]